MMELNGYTVAPLHTGLVISDYGAHEVGVTVCGVQHVLGGRVQSGPKCSVSLLTMKI
jgi:hypothetical protein